MIIIKILLIEIALVVVINFHHVSAMRSYCETLLHQSKMFPGSGRNAGLENFKHAYRHLSLDEINAKIDLMPYDSESAEHQSEKSILTELAKAYFWYLMDGIFLWNNEKDLFFLYPNELSPDYERYIVPQFLEEEDIQMGKLRILIALYANWFYEKIDSFKENSSNSVDLISELPGDVTYEDNTSIEDLNSEFPGGRAYVYALNYFTHVDGFVSDSIHSSYASRFGNIYKFCRDKGIDITKVQ